MTTGRNRLLGILTVAFAAGAAVPAAADWWYAVYDGDKHIGYCHVVESSASLGNTLVKRFTAVTEAKRDKTGQFKYKWTVDRYRNGGSLVYFSSALTLKDKTTTVRATRTAEGFKITITKGEKEETVEVAADDFGMIEAEEALEKLASPGAKIEVRVLDPATGKVRKTKIEYVSDQTLEVAGETVATKVLQAKGGLGGATFWFDEEGALVKRVGKTPLGKVTYMVTEAASAKP